MLRKNKNIEEEIIYFYNVKDGKYYQSRYTHRWLNNLQNQVQKQKEIIDKAIEYIKHYETIRGYYEYEECGYDEYNYEEDLKEELLDILKEVKTC